MVPVSSVVSMLQASTPTRSSHRGGSASTTIPLWPFVTVIGMASTYCLGQALLRIRVGQRRKLGKVLVASDQGGQGYRRRLGLLERWYVAHSRAGTHTGFCFCLELTASASGDGGGVAPDADALRQCLLAVSKQFAWLRCKVGRDGVDGVDSRIRLTKKDSVNSSKADANRLTTDSVWGDDLYVEEMPAERCQPTIKTLVLDKPYSPPSHADSDLHQILQDESIRVWHDEDFTRPLWRVTLVQWNNNDNSGVGKDCNESHKFALVLSFHHLIIDGMSALRVARAIMEFGGRKGGDGGGFNAGGATRPCDMPLPMEDVVDTTPRIKDVLLPVFCDRFPKLASLLFPQPWQGNTRHCAYNPEDALTTVSAENNIEDSRTSQSLCLVLLETSSQVTALRQYCSKQSISPNAVISAALLKALAVVATRSRAKGIDPIRFSIEVAADERRRRAKAISYDSLGPFVTGPKVHATVDVMDSIESIGRSFARQLRRALESSPRGIGLMAFIRGDWIHFSRKMCGLIPNGVRDSLSLSLLTGTGMDDSLTLSSSEEASARAWQLENLWFVQGRRGFGAAVRANVLGTANYMNASLSSFPEVVSPAELEEIALMWKSELAAVLEPTL